MGRSGIRQVNAVLVRAEATRIQFIELGQRDYRNRLTAGDSTSENLHCLKRRLVRRVFQHLRTDRQDYPQPFQPTAA
jgi:hypothetical protein